MNSSLVFDDSGATCERLDVNVTLSNTLYVNDSCVETNQVSQTPQKSVVYLFLNFF